MREDGDLIENRRPEPKPVATIVIIALNVLVYFIQRQLLNGGSLRHHSHAEAMANQYFALSLEGLKHGYVWQLLTFQFMHGGIFHILLNSWAIYMFGRIIEFSAGWKQFIKIYLLSGIIGGLTQMILPLLLPNWFDDAPVVGASAGASGLVAAFAILYPRQILYLVLVVIPVKMRAISLMWLTIFMSVFGIFYPLIIKVFPPINALLGSIFENVAHAAHLGGTLTGLLLAKQLLNAARLRRPPVINEPENNLNVNVVPD